MDLFGDDELKPAPSPLVLRPYQTEIVQAVQAFWDKGGKRGLVVAATGTGKTFTFNAVIKAMAEGDLGATFLCLGHRKELLDQMLGAAQTINPHLPSSIHSGDFVGKRGSSIVCASVQSLSQPGSTALDWLSPSLVIADESHHSASKSWQAVFSRFGCYDDDTYTKLLGFTATPHRLDNKALVGKIDKAIFEEIVYRYDIVAAIKDGFLVDLKGYRAAAQVDLSKVKVQHGDYQQGALEDAMNVDPVNLLAYESWLTAGKGHQTIVFCAGVDHAKTVAEVFREKGVKAAAVWGDMPPKDRAETIDAFRRGEIQVLTNMDILTEGFDCLDQETQVLTPDGWKGIGEVNEGDLVHSFNKESGQMEIVPALRVVERDVRPGEKMVTIKSQRVDIRVTEGHEFHLIRRSNRPKWDIYTAGQIFEQKFEYKIPIAAERVDLPGLPLTDDDLRLIGWLLTDGSVSKKTGAARIYQSESKHSDYIRSLLTRMGLDFSEYRTVNKADRPGSFQGTKPMITFSIPKGIGTNKRNGWAYLAQYLSKKIDASLDGLSVNQFRVLWDEMMLANGSKSNPLKSGWLWMPTQRQADRLMALAIERGFATSCAKEKTPAGNDVWRISIRDSQFLILQPKIARSAPMTSTEPESPEKVWCVTNRNSTLVTRRNGKTAILGNCRQAGCVILLRPTKSWSLFVQMIGRGLRTLPGIIEGLEFDPSQERRRAIKQSEKPECVVIDIVAIGGGEAGHNAGEKHDGKGDPSLNALVGLPEGLELEGHSVIEALEQFEELPEVVKSVANKRRKLNFDDLTAVLSQVEMLLEIEPPEEAVENGELYWLKTGDLSYSLDCGSQGGVTRHAIMQGDFLGKWILTISSTFREPKMFILPSDLPLAFRAAEGVICNEFAGAKSLMSRKANWRTGAPTLNQVMYLKNKGIEEDILNNLTKGSASAMISVIRNKEAREADKKAADGHQEAA